MNEIEKIEKLLRNAPRIKPPNGLREKLQTDISLSSLAAEEPVANNWRPLVRRWLPALSFSALFLASLVAIAVQSNTLSELRRENQTLRASQPDLEQLRQQNSEYQKLRAENEKLGQLLKDRSELQKLRDEIGVLREQLRQLALLQAENQRLLAANKAAENRVPTDPREEDPFGAARRQSARIHCINNIKQISLAARLWSKDNGDNLPSDFLSMSNELNSPKTLICPGDTNRAESLNWSGFGPANVSYELISPGISEVDPAVVYLRCPIHNNVGLVDGSAHMLGPNVRLIQKNGKWYRQAGAIENPN